MTEERDNYGVEPGSGGGLGPDGSTTMMGSRDEDTWSALAHLSIFLNLFTGFLGPVGALVIWLIYKDRSPRVGFHALQSLWYQLAWMVILVVGWTLTTFLMIVLVGFLLVPVMIVASLVPFVHMAYAAYKVNQGVDYRYPWISDLVDGRRHTGI
ncbi:MAG TPA: DUF4870 domain-containing protein [Rubrobacter sp.]|nr:DUF4870 domain-containing protein [Rubrobacter sp.]